MSLIYTGDQTIPADADNAAYVPTATPATVLKSNLGIIAVIAVIGIIAIFLSRKRG
jgi:hypothetical protein